MSKAAEADSMDTDLVPEALLAPLDGEDRCGEPLRYEGTFDRIREARRADDPNLPQGVWETDVKRADWRAVEKLTTEALSKRSKDLHLAVWLAEAWTHLEGLRGFRRGLDLISSFSEEYWPDMFPRIDEDGDLDYRLGPLRWAAEQFPNMLRLVPITAPDGDAEPMRLKDWQDVLRIDNLRQRDAEEAEREQRRYPTRQAFEASVDLTPVERIAELIPVAEACLGELERLDLFLEEQCPKEAPSMSRIRGALTDIDGRLRAWLEQKGGVLPGEEETEEDGTTDLPGEEETDTMATVSDGSSTDTAAATAPNQPAVASGPIRSRAEAYKRLSEVADYLIRTEPHSPVPYLIKRAVAWGNMGFGELLVELIEGGGDHHRVLRLLGLDSVGKNLDD